MITKTKSSVPGCVHIIFELPSCLWADHIYLIGDFNDWKPHTLPIHQARDGVWRIELDLPCGRTYEFRYLVDDRWLTDSHADGLVANPYGAQNSIVDATLPVALLQLDRTQKQAETGFWRKATSLSQVDGGKARSRNALSISYASGCDACSASINPPDLSLT